MWVNNWYPELLDGTFHPLKMTSCHCLKNKSWQHFKLLELVRKLDTSPVVLKFKVDVEKIDIKLKSGKKDQIVNDNHCWRAGRKEGKGEIRSYGEAIRKGLWRGVWREIDYSQIKRPVKQGEMRRPIIQVKLVRQNRQGPHPNSPNRLHAIFPHRSIKYLIPITIK